MELNRENYLKIKNNDSNFSKISHINSKLVWGNKANDNPTISIIIPTYRREIELEKAITSVLNQTEHNIDFEILVMDNSADFSENNNTFKLISKINSNKILYYINEENLGQAGNWNRGFELANGKFAALLHDDDLLSSNYFAIVEKDIELAQKKTSKIGFLRGLQVTFAVDDQINNFDISYKNNLKEYKKIHSLFSGIGPSSCPSCGILFNPKAVIEVGGFNQDYYPSFDYIVGYQILRSGYKVYFSDSIYGFYRIGINESMRKENLLNFVNCDYFFREVLYSENLLYRFLGLLFRKVQYKKSIMSMHAVSLNQFHQNIALEEFDFNKFFFKRTPIKTI